MWLILRLLFAAAVSVWATIVSAEDVVLNLQRVEVDPPGAQFPSVTETGVQGVDPYYGSYSSQHSWSALPKRIGPQGFQISLSVTGVSSDAYIHPGTSISARGFAITPTESNVFADARDGKTDTKSATFTLVPDGISPGSEVRIDVGASYGAGVRFYYLAEPWDGQPVVQDEDDGIIEEQQPVLTARLECDSDTIVISAFPTLSCAIVISGWRTSSYPVEVLLPDIVDGFGNQANGLQSVLNGQYGAQDATNWYRPEYRWALPVFACPSQDNSGANCYDFAAVPGVLTMPIIVRQKDQVDVSLLLTLNAVSRDAEDPEKMTGGAFRFGSVWRIGEFINTEYGPPGVGGIRADWLSAQWRVNPTSDGFVRLESAWYPGNFLHVENGPLELGPIGEAWWSAQWVLEPVPGSNFMRIGNRWRTGEYLNVETGALQLTGIAPEWLSAMWWTLP